MSNNTNIYGNVTDSRICIDGRSSGSFNRIKSALLEAQNDGLIACPNIDELSEQILSDLLTTDASNKGAE